MIVTPDWIVALCARAMFDLHMEREAALHNVDRDALGTVVYLHEWDDQDPRDKKPWTERAWKVVVEGKSDKELFAAEGKTELGPVGKALLFEGVQEENALARSLGKLLMEARSAAQESGAAARTRKTTDYAESKALNEGAKEGALSMAFSHRFHRLWSRAVGSPDYDKAPWMKLDARMSALHEARPGPADIEGQRQLLADATALCEEHTDKKAYAATLHLRAHELDTCGTRPDLVERDYLQALALDPLQPAWWADLVGFYLATEQHKKAIEAADEARFTLVNGMLGPELVRAFGEPLLRTLARIEWQTGSILGQLYSVILQCPGIRPEEVRRYKLVKYGPAGPEQDAVRALLGEAPLPLDRYQKKA